MTARVLLICGLLLASTPASAGKPIDVHRLVIGNGGAPEYYIGSADMGPRTLRRRVELLAPVRARACRAQLDAIMDAYLADPCAWELTAAGEYLRRHGTGPSTQDQLLEQPSGGRA